MKRNLSRLLLAACAGLGLAACAGPNTADSMDASVSGARSGSMTSGSTGAAGATATSGTTGAVDSATGPAEGASAATRGDRR